MKGLTDESDEAGRRQSEKPDNQCFIPKGVCHIPHLLQVDLFIDREASLVSAVGRGTVS